MKLLTQLCLCFGIACLGTVPALADTYTVYKFADANDYGLVGINAAGDILLYNVNLSRYEIYDDGALISTSATMPSFTTDNGAACAAPAGTGGRAVCDGSREIYTSTGNPTTDYYELYPGSSAAGDFVANGFLFDSPIPGTPDTSAALNSSGDFVYIDGHDEEIIEFAAATTPEPSSLMLLGTGIAGIATLLRRRRGMATTADHASV